VSDDASCKEVQEQNELRTRLRAIRRALDELRGSYALVILFRDQPDVLLAARCGSPLLIGAADDGYLIGSDVHAISHRAQRLTRLEDHDLAVVRADSLQILQADFSVSPRVMLSCVDASDDEAELGDFPHFTLKEIHQQPASLHRVLSAANLLVGAQDSGSLSVLPSRILIVACGTSWHAGLYGKYLIEELAGIPVDLEYASEYRYRSAPIQEGTMMIAVSQSGETADTVGALHDFQRSGQPTLAICNVPNSTLAQEADGAIFLNVGQEQGVAATKSYTAQCAVFSRLAVEFGQRRGMLEGRFGCLADDMHRLPELVSQILENGDAVRQLAEQFDDASGFLFVGRCYEYATAMEGALKLKEISYLHAEGHAAGELKHGPLALVDEDTVTVALATPGRAYEKTLSSLQEIRARGGRILAVGGEGDERLAGVADEVFSVPVVDECLQPLLNIIPLQLLAYHIADNRGCDVDRPRNLAKSVTVE
jgi:glucosamine--fructose-6-phosphate aminotransferase (isomerizing)